MKSSRGPAGLPAQQSDQSTQSTLNQMRVLLLFLLVAVLAQAAPVTPNIRTSEERRVADGWSSQIPRASGGPAPNSNPSTSAPVPSQARSQAHSPPNLARRAVTVNSVAPTTNPCEGSCILGVGLLGIAALMSLRGRLGKLGKFGETRLLAAPRVSGADAGM